jgi:hypothetical protein
MQSDHSIGTINKRDGLHDTAYASPWAFVRAALAQRPLVLGPLLWASREQLMEDRTTARIAGLSLAGISLTCMVLAAIALS